ncbi:Sec61-gamma [Giardia muris]|uniref:Sec61-gamma n=1 Tax=Giardia muris TaxID=5742 RepID=A0A4Z1SSH5_GIAMU|nr:Sec61-gamma [Giardia muris]|eukprot:TNJ27925.1 Sec61-gamma [Giardia muris]
MSEHASLVRSASAWVSSGRRFWNGCEKPTGAEVRKLAISTSIGVLAIGVTGFIIKTISYPIFRLLAGSGAAV